MTIENKAKQLVSYINSLSDFEIVKLEIPYYHMGATITDAILQAGINWENVVKPRVRKVYNYPEAKTTTGFLNLSKKIDLKELLDWKNSEKPNRISRVIHLFIGEGIETEADLKPWLEDDANILKLKEIEGIGDKTVDYFKILSGIQTSAINRHQIEFLKRAGIDRVSYSEAKEIINKAADQMGISRSVLDHSIWRYMSRKKRR